MKKRLSHPNITLLNRDLSENYFNNVIAELRDNKVDYSIHIDKLHLYKHNGEVWEVFSEIQLG